MNKKNNLDREESEMGFWRQVFNGVFVARLLVGAILGSVPVSVIAFGISDWVADRSNERMNTIDSNISDLSSSIDSLNTSVININGDIAGQIRDGLQPIIEANNRRADNQTALIARAQEDIEDNTALLDENVLKFTKSISDLKLEMNELGSTIKSASFEVEAVAEMSDDIEILKTSQNGNDKKLGLILDALGVPDEKR